jgi:hypothetical protein
MAVLKLCTQGCRNLEAVHTEQTVHAGVQMPLNLHTAVQFCKLWIVKKSVRAPFHIFPAKLLSLRKKFGWIWSHFGLCFLRKRRADRGPRFQWRHFEEQNVSGDIWYAILLLSRRCGTTSIPCYESQFFFGFSLPR